ncbi:MAG: hypothetical protein LH479_12640 [Polaromonas sp.]|nr:hypothetical protein [Polaromonas sp.]
MSALALRLYAGLMWLVQPLLRLKLARRAARESGYAQAVGERFGHYNQPVESRRELVWLHAVSLGETRTAAVLLKALRDAHPGLRVLLTHGTATGRAEGLGLLAPGDLQVWQPWDSPAAVARFLDHFKPRVGLLMETEVWPCLVAAADARAVPRLLVNARLSEKSLLQALRMGPLALPAFAALKQVYAQTADGAARFAQLGVVVAGVFGNLKFDAEPDAAQQAQGRAWRSVAAGPVLMFASSRDGEEAAFFNEIIALRQQIRARSAPFSIATDGRSQGADDLGSDLGSDLTEGLVVGGEEREAERVGSGFSAGLTTGADGRVDGRAPQRADGRVDGRVAAPVQAWPDADADGDAGSASPARARSGRFASASAGAGCTAQHLACHQAADRAAPPASF